MPGKTRRSRAQLGILCPADAPSRAPPALLNFHVLPQPDETTCGPTCLHAVYAHYGDHLPLQQVIDEVPVLAAGGTLAVNLARHALRRGYRARIYTYNLQTFDPSWFRTPRTDIATELVAQMEAKDKPRLREASIAYLDFLSLGGEIRFEPLGRDLLGRYLSKGIPLLTGLSATYLYSEPREIPATNRPDPVRGEPVGHFVVLNAYDEDTDEVQVADPLDPNPMCASRSYSVDIESAMGAILLGVITFDANLLVVRPAGADAHR